MIISLVSILRSPDFWAEAPKVKNWVFPVEVRRLGQRHASFQAPASWASASWMCAGILRRARKDYWQTRQCSSVRKEGRTRGGRADTQPPAERGSPKKFRVLLLKYFQTLDLKRPVGEESPTEDTEA